MNFEFQSDGGAVEVTVTHAGGDGIRASRLVVNVGSDSRPWPGSGTVGEGDSATFSAESGTTIRVVYDPGERAGTMLARHTVR